MLTVSELYIYPVKSLGGIALEHAALTDRGFEHDRRWMLVDKENNFLTQRELPQMALLKTNITAEGLSIQHINNTNAPLLIRFEETTDERLMVDVWSDRCRAVSVSSHADEWLSDILSFNCRLVYMPDSVHRRVDSRYAHEHEITSFSDGYPLLIIGQASLDDLNERLAQPVPMNRFRPNIVFTGGEPFQEDEMKHFRINNISFSAVKPCARCVMTTIDQTTGAKNKEPLATLAKYRFKNNKIYFGQNLLFKGSGMVNVGDELIYKESYEL